MSHPSPLPTVVIVLAVKSKLFFGFFRLNCFTAEMRTMSAFSFFAARRMGSTPSNLTIGRLKRRPSRNTSLLASSGVKSSAYHTLFLRIRRICIGSTYCDFTTISAVRLEPMVSSVRSSVSVKRNRSPSSVFSIRFFKGVLLFSCQKCVFGRVAAAEKFQFPV